MDSDYTDIARDGVTNTHKTFIWKFSRAFCLEVAAASALFLILVLLLRLVCRCRMNRNEEQTNDSLLDPLLSQATDTGNVEYDIESARPDDPERSLEEEEREEEDTIDHDLLLKMSKAERALPSDLESNLPKDPNQHMEAIRAGDEAHGMPRGSMRWKEKLDFARRKLRLFREQSDATSPLTVCKTSMDMKNSEETVANSPSSIARIASLQQGEHVLIPDHFSQGGPTHAESQSYTKYLYEKYDDLAATWAAIAKN